MKFSPFPLHVVCGKKIRDVRFAGKGRSYWLRPNAHSFHYCSCLSPKYPYPLRRTPYRQRIHRKAWPCFSCKVDTRAIHEMYMVHNRIWTDAFAEKPPKYACIACLENRMRRRLNPKDFTFFPINTEPLRKRSDRLKTRLYESGLFQK